MCVTIETFICKGAKSIKGVNNDAWVATTNHMMGTHDGEHWREYALTLSPIGKQKCGRNYI